MSRSRRKAFQKKRFTITNPGKRQNKSLILTASTSTPSADMETKLPEVPARDVFEAELRLQAYLKWEASGRPPGDGHEFWLAAERELRGS